MCVHESVCCIVAAAASALGSGYAQVNNFKSQE